MKPTLNAFGKVCFLNCEISGGTLAKAGYTVEEVLAMDSKAEQRAVLEKIEQNRRLERATEDARSGQPGQNSGISFGAGSSVKIGGHAVGGNLFEK